MMPLAPWWIRPPRRAGGSTSWSTMPPPSAGAASRRWTTKPRQAFQRQRESLLRADPGIAAAHAQTGSWAHHHHVVGYRSEGVDARVRRLSLSGLEGRGHRFRSYRGDRAGGGHTPAMSGLKARYGAERMAYFIPAKRVSGERRVELHHRRNLRGRWWGAASGKSGLRGVTGRIPAGEKVGAPASPHEDLIYSSPTIRSPNTDLANARVIGPPPASAA